MAGTRTAPTVDGSPSSVSVTLHLIDASGDLFTEQMSILPARTDGEIEAWAAKYQLATNSSIWKITGVSVYEGAKAVANAVAEFRSGIQNGINQVYKDTATGETEDQRIVSPVAAIMEANTDTPDMGDVVATDLIAATIVMKPSFTYQRAQYTSRRERSNNPVVPG